MALAFASQDTTTATATSVVVDKPTGLAEGDLMIASFIALVTGETLIPPSGFTVIEQYTTPSVQFEVYAKIATAGDAAAANFTFQKSGGASVALIAGIGRVTRTSGSWNLAMITAEMSSNSTTSATVTFSNTITPPSSSNDFLMAFFVGQYSVSSAQTASTYAITNDNPTWTERWDTLNGDVGIHLATGPRTAETATGTSSVDLQNSGNSKIGIGVMMVIAETVDVTNTPAVIDVATSVQAPTVTGGASTSPAVISSSVNVQDPTVTTPADTWSKQAKNTTTWTTQDKS